MGICARIGNKVAFGHLQRHRALHRDHVLLAHRAHQKVRRPGLHLVFVDQPRRHIGSGKLKRAVERTGKLRLRLQTDQILGVFEPRAGQVGCLLEIYAKLHIHRGLDGCAGGFSVRHQREAITKEEKPAGMIAGSTTVAPLTTWL